MECTSCENDYTYVGQHYRQSSCEYPSLSQEQLEIVEGLLMSDGYIYDDGNNLRFGLEMKNREFINWVSERLSEFTTSVTERDGYYKLRTIRSPVFTELYDKWYTNKKTFPQITLTPTRLKMWYVGDGHLHNDGRGFVSIGCANEFENQEKLTDMLSVIDSSPSFYSNSIYFSVDETDRFFEYIGEPVSGFGRKWRDANGQ